MLLHWHLLLTWLFAHTHTQHYPEMNLNGMLFAIALELAFELAFCSHTHQYHTEVNLNGEPLM
jgi:hypothetical protein